MTVVIILCQLAVFLVLPAYLIRFSHRYKFNQVFSDIVICYGIGMVLGNLKVLVLDFMADDGWLDSVNAVAVSASRYLAFVAVALAIPMLLMVNNVTDWIRYTGKIIPVFFLGVCTTLFVTLTMGYLFRHDMPDIATVSGMMAGVYIGGTPNMVAISRALNADEHIFLLLNATDTICSGLYFFLLISIGKIMIGWILKPFQSKQNPVEQEAEKEEEHEHSFPPHSWSSLPLRPLALATLIALLAVALSVIPAFLLADPLGEPNQALLMLTLTTVGILLSFIPAIRTLPGVFSYAQYLLLIFGLAAGFLTDFSQLAGVGGAYLKFNIMVIVGIISIHLLLARLIKSDTDSFMISSTACVMGPPFVAQVASALKNKELLPVGIALSLLGFGLANYAGMAVAWIVGQF
jgi:uncharacterized membrane protein